MSQPRLFLAHSVEVAPASIPFSEKLADHHAIIQSFLDTYTTRNLSDNTTYDATRFLNGWFDGFAVKDENHPDGERQLFIWEAMAPVLGRQRIVEFSKGLIQAGLKGRTVTKYLSLLRRLFDYVLSYPYIPGSEVQPITHKYGGIEQPVLEFDYPSHVLDHEAEGFVPTGQKLLDFYDFIRLEYIGHNQKKLPASRDYAMIVLAGESGLRAVELRRLDALGRHRDLFYDQGRVQTRFGKGTRGSGPRTRKTIFTPFAQDTLRPYETRIRPAFPCARTEPALFLSESGTRLTYDAMWRNLHVIVEAARNAGVELPPKFSWHSLRKCFATNFIERYPERVWELMDMLGHVSPFTLHRYVFHSRAYFDASIDQLIEELTTTPPRDEE
jgi:site-specific recombinase XerD